MKLSELFRKIPQYSNHRFRNDCEITGITYDSRKVREGNIFFAVRGLKDDGRKYIHEAIRKGARIVFSEDESGNADSAEIIKTENIRKLMALASREFYNKESDKIKLIGITGTNGKTTTAYLIKFFLEKAGYRTGLIGTIDYQVGETTVNSVLTTPDSPEMNMMIGEMTGKKTDFCIMEVSSIALVMDRVYGLNFDTAVFTNLTSEHLDFHKNMENYFESKKLLFDGLGENKFAVSNKDDEYGEKILEGTKALKKYYSVNCSSDFKAMNEKLTLNGIEFDALYKNEIYRFSTQLAGRFNIYNIIAAVTSVLNYDTDISFLQKTLREFQEVSGRFNRIKLQNGAVAVVDYSHTSDSLKKAIETAREIVNSEKKNGRVITVFGCGGNKDRTKRPVMGEYATELSDYAVITSDNPRFEDPMKIIDEILAGIRSKNNFEVIENREDAIRRAIEISEGNDIILICGKGHETYQEIKGVRAHFNDREIISEYSAFTE